MTGTKGCHLSGQVLWRCEETDEGRRGQLVTETKDARPLLTLAGQRVNVGGRPTRLRVEQKHERPLAGVFRFAKLELVIEVTPGVVFDGSRFTAGSRLLEQFDRQTRLLVLDQTPVERQLARNALAGDGCGVLGW
jgi:hypothetical protein